MPIPQAPRLNIFQTEIWNIFLKLSRRRTDTMSLKAITGIELSNCLNEMGIEHSEYREFVVDVVSALDDRYLEKKSEEMKQK